MLRRSAAALRAAYPRLRVHASSPTTSDGCRRCRTAERRLVAFLGSTIGNFDAARAIVASCVGCHRRAPAAGRHAAARRRPGQADGDRCEAAYNDAAGVTAEFNRNILRVINRELGADFDPTASSTSPSSIPTRRRSRCTCGPRGARGPHRGARPDASHFAAGETIHTEISRKFTRAASRRCWRPAASVSSAGTIAGRRLRAGARPRRGRGVTVARQTGTTRWGGADE